MRSNGYYENAKQSESFLSNGHPSHSNSHGHSHTHGIIRTTTAAASSPRTCQRSTVLWCCMSVVITITLMIMLLQFSPAARTVFLESPKAFLDSPTALLLHGHHNTSFSSSSSTSSLLSVTEWLSHSISIPFLLQHGFEPGPAAARYSPVDNAAIQHLRSVVEANELTRNFDNTLIVGVVNFGYLDFALNWICFIQRHNISNYLLATVDQESYRELSLLGYQRHIISLETLFHDPDLHWCGGAHTHQYRTVCFNKQTQMKTKLVLTSLLAGYNTFLSDMDISFIHNPFLYLPLVHSWEMQLEPNEWCTGFYYNKATYLTVSMQTQVLHGIEAYPAVDDQEVYNKWIAYHRLITPEVLNKELYPMDYELFPIGKHYGTKTAIIQHNNWIFGANEKRVKQLKFGFQLYNKSKTDDARTIYLAEWETEARTHLPSNWTGAVPVPDSYPLHDSILVCEYCVACEEYQPVLPPLRATWPGPLLITNFTRYRGPDTNHY